MFDMTIIYASFIMVVLPIILNNDEVDETQLDGAKTVTTPMRIVSRVAVRVQCRE